MTAAAHVITDLEVHEIAGQLLKCQCLGYFCFCV